MSTRPLKSYIEKMNKRSSSEFKKILISLNISTLDKEELDKRVRKELFKNPTDKIAMKEFHFIDDVPVMLVTVTYDLKVTIKVIPYDIANRIEKTIQDEKEGEV